MGKAVDWFSQSGRVAADMFLDIWPALALYVFGILVGAVAVATYVSKREQVPADLRLELQTDQGSLYFSATEQGVDDCEAVRAHLGIEADLACRVERR